MSVSEVGWEKGATLTGNTQGKASAAGGRAEGKHSTFGKGPTFPQSQATLFCSWLYAGSSAQYADSIILALAPALKKLLEGERVNTGLLTGACDTRELTGRSDHRMGRTEEKLRWRGSLGWKECHLSGRWLGDQDGDCEHSRQLSS